MRKIKGFKLALRAQNILRRAKKAGLDMDAWGYAAAQISWGSRPKEAAPTPEFESYLHAAASSMQPAVLFESFSKKQAADAAGLAPLPGLAWSLITATLGPGFENYKSAQAETASAKAPLLSLIEESALEDAVRFATSLLEEEALTEGCELSPLSPITESAALELVLNKLSGDKIGLSLKEGRLDPPASRAVSLSWLVKSRSKKTAK